MTGYRTRNAVHSSRWTNAPRTVHPGDRAVLVFCVVAFVVLLVTGAL